MTAQPHDFVPGGAQDPAKRLRAIRAALVVRQDREAFDAGLMAALDEVRVSLDLGVLNDFAIAGGYPRATRHATILFAPDRMAINRSLNGSQRIHQGRADRNRERLGQAPAM